MLASMPARRKRRALGIRRTAVYLTLHCIALSVDTKSIASSYIQQGKTALAHLTDLCTRLLQVIDLDTSVEGGMKKLIDAAGAGTSFTSPGWLTQLGRLWGGKSVRRCPSTAGSRPPA